MATGTHASPVSGNSSWSLLRRRRAVPATQKCTPPPTGGAAPQRSEYSASAGPPSAANPSAAGPGYQPAGVSRVRSDHLKSGKPAQQLGQHQLASIPVLNVGGMYCHGQEQSHGVYYDVALAPSDLFPSVIPPGPPFSVVFTDWLSMIAALGVASRPSASRTRGRSASSMPSQVPSVLHFRKYHHTVPQGGTSWGAMRQGMPPRNIYRMPFTTSRRSTVRGCSLGLFGGSKGANLAH